MATELPVSNGQNGDNSFEVKAGLARMLKGGVIMDVVNAEQVCRALFAPPKYPNSSTSCFRGEDEGKVC